MRNIELASYLRQFKPIMMKKYRLLLSMRMLFLTLMIIGWGNVGWGQPVIWNYDFGTGTGTYSTSGSSTSFFSDNSSASPVDGGTYRIRLGAGGGAFTLANPGTSLGDATELQINAATGTSTNKFGVYDWTNPSPTFYLKAKIRTTSTNTGQLNISVGNSTLVTDNNGFTGHYNNVLANFTIMYNSSGSICYR